MTFVPFMVRVFDWLPSPGAQSTTTTLKHTLTCDVCALKVLAKKMTVLYKLAKEQLSKQFHYDFGLRALKSVLVMGGGLKRASSGLDEASVLMRTLRDMNLPKLVYDDVPLFLGLLSDLFPGTAPQKDPSLHFERLLHPGCKLHGCASLDYDDLRSLKQKCCRPCEWHILDIRQGANT